MKQLIIYMIVGVVSFSLGRQTVEPIELKCPVEIDHTLVASKFSKEEITCVYIESYKLSNKRIKRKEYVIQKKTT